MSGGEDINELLYALLASSARCAPQPYQGACLQVLNAMRRKAHCRAENKKYKNIKLLQKWIAKKLMVSNFLFLPWNLFNLLFFEYL